MVEKAIIRVEEEAPEPPEQTEWHLLFGGVQEPLYDYFTVLRQLEGGAMKRTALTPEYLRELGEGMRDQILASLSPEQRLAGLSPKIS